MHLRRPACSSWPARTILERTTGARMVAVIPRRRATRERASGALASFTTPADPGGGGILFAASGEALALTGYPFPPVSSGDPCFVDGWDVKFTRLLVTVDKIELSENPDMSPGDESQNGKAGRRGRRAMGDRPVAQRSELPAWKGRRRRRGGSDRRAEESELERQCRVHDGRHALRVRFRLDPRDREDVRRPRDDEREHRCAGPSGLREHDHQRLRRLLLRRRDVQRRSGSDSRCATAIPNKRRGRSR